MGDRVYDTESDSAVAVVIHLPDTEADRWDVDDKNTFHDFNPDYPEDSEVVIVAFKEYLNEWWSEWSDCPEDELSDEMCERGHKFYAFAAPRLSKAEGGLARI